MLLWKKYNAFSLILCDGHQKAWICIHNPSRLGIIIQSYTLSINKLVVYLKNYQLRQQECLDPKGGGGLFYENDRK